MPIIYGIAFLNWGFARAVMHFLFWSVDGTICQIRVNTSVNILEPMMRALYKPQRNHTKRALVSI